MKTLESIPAHAAATAEVRLEAGGRAVVVLRGRLDSLTAMGPWRQVEQRFHKVAVATLEVDAGGIEYCDGSGMALLHCLQMGFLTPGATVTVRGLTPELQRSFDNFSAADYRASVPPPPLRNHIPTDLGRGARAMARDFVEQVRFIGAVTQGLAGTLFRPRLMRWDEVMRVFESAGANALPIVSLISLLVGLVIAFEAAQPLELFGAQIFIADMIGLVMVRELGPMMAAIILAGRSGSAFAAELGTMKVNEELNALQTMGLDPVRFLVVQRVVASVLLTPLLTVYAMFMGVLGGVLVMLGIGFPLVAIYNQLIVRLTAGDVLIGTTKGVVFGLIVAAVGCLRGLQTLKGPSAVGESTTRAVVSSILLIIVTDAGFSILLYVLRQ